MDGETCPPSRGKASGQPLLPLACAFGLGILLESWLGASARVWVGVFLGFLLAALILWRAGSPRLSHLFVVAGFLGLGAETLAVVLLEAPANHLSRLPEGWLAAPVRLEAWVVAPPDPAPPDRRDVAGPDRTQFVAEVQELQVGDRWMAVAGRARLTLYGEPVHLAYGQAIQGTFRLRKPRAFGNPGAFDYSGYLASQGIFLEGWSPGPLEVGEATAGSPVMAEVFRLRGLLLRRFGEALPSGQAALLKAMVLGDRSGLTPEMQEAFLGSGTYHILAISGLNVSLLAGAAFGVLRLLRVSGRFAALLSILLVTLYAGLAGAGSSVVRAGIMADVYLLALVLDRQISLLNSLALSALLLLWWNPYALFEVGFQLTFLATLGIILAVPAVEERLAAFRRPVRYLLGSAAITIAATAMTAPILAVAFNRLTPIGLLANLPVVPLSGAITAVGLAAGAGLLALPAGLPWLTQAGGALVDLLFVVTRWFAACPWGSVLVYTPTPGMTLCYYGALAGIALLLKEGPRSARIWAGGLTAACTLALVSQVAVWLYPPPADDRVRLTLLDVGQGEAILLELPDRGRIMVDAGGLLGGSFDVGRRIVAPFLWRKWIGRLDVVIVSHPETDHVHGIASLLETMPVGEIWIGPAPAESVTAVRLAALLLQRGIPQRVVTSDSPPFHFGAATLEIVHPAPRTGMGAPAGTRSRGVNDATLVVRLGLADKAILLTGDLGRDGEAALLKSGRPVRAQVLKVPHHGSRTSSTAPFLRAVAPEIAVLSAGYRNRFRHPHPEIVERYRAMGVRLLRTDLDGAISVEMTPEGIRAWGYRERESQKDQ
ncbi:MAG: DNA internalization-related competence protein ComEC/Rec2 [candidate division NC10 bacterium]|nr:DNA internalization-related competence protein ComEC/Rec2 [candidate division NC10 bacterium]